jgi:hypothetical protein
LAGCLRVFCLRFVWRTNNPHPPPHIQQNDHPNSPKSKQNQNQNKGADAIARHLLRGFLAARAGELDLAALEGAVGGGK